MPVPEVSRLRPGDRGAFWRFGKYLLGWEPHPKQEEFGDSPARLLHMICGIRFGKSDALKVKYLQNMTFTPNGRFLNVGPTQDQANIVVEAAHAAAMSGPLAVLVDRYVRSPHPLLVFKNGAQLQGRSTDDADLLRGKAYDGIGVDEAALCRQGDIDVLRGRLMDRSGWLALVTSPKGKDWLFASYVNAEGRQANGDPHYFAATGTTWDNPHIPRAEIERIRDECLERGRDKWYRQEIMGEFVDLEGATFPREVLDRIFLRGLPIETAPIPGGIYVAGWDLGRKTTWTVGTVIECSTERFRVVESVRLSGAPWQTIYRSIEDVASRWGAHTIIDGTGVGDVVHDSLSIPAEPFIFTRKSREGLITTLQSVAHQPGALTIPAETHRELFTQMLLHTWQEDAEGQTWDDLDSLMLAVHHAREITFRGPLLTRLN